MKVHVINHPHGMLVHRAGCKDIRKALSGIGTGCSEWTLDVPADADVATFVAADISAGFDEPEPGEPPPWTASDLTVFPCVKKGPA